jgi:hypothetical protein
LDFFTFLLDFPERGELACESSSAVVKSMIGIALLYLEPDAKVAKAGLDGDMIGDRFERVLFIR